MQYELGNIVTLKSSGLLVFPENHFLSQGGNENFVIPLMVVVEINFGTDPEIDELTGEVKLKVRGENQYKCLYFSNKSMKFEENWFYENELEKYDKDNIEIHQNTETSDVKWGDIVRFKTIDIEAGKKKSFNSETKQKTSTPLLTFVSPVLQVIGFGQADKKESLVDGYSGKKKRKKSEKLVKCKFFNKELDKFSEQLIPIECLQKIDNSNLKVNLEKVSNVIKNNDLVILNERNNKLFGRPISAHEISGRFQLLFWNELLKKNEIICFDHINEIITIDVNAGSGYYPGINQVDGEDKVVDLKGYLEKNDVTSNILKIVYRNLKDQVTSRYIYVKKVGEPDDRGSNENNPIYYLKSYCYYREAEREFRSDRILSIRTFQNNDFIAFLHELRLK